MAGTPDELQRGLAEGVPSAFADLFDQFGPGLFRVACGLLGSSEDAEDAVQDVFVALVQAGPRLLQVHDWKAYLFAALRNAATRRRTRAQRLPIQPIADAANLPEVEPAPPADPDARLERALAKLPAEQREVVVLKIDGGLTFAELGNALGISANTAASRYRYALEKLRTAIKEASDDSA